jgi:SnoaL-like domain
MSTRAVTWNEEFYAAVDGMDPEAVGRRCTGETLFVLGNHEPSVGRQALVDGLRQFWSTIAAMHHQFERVLEDDDTAALQALVTYTRLDGSKVSIPSTSWIRRQGNLIAEQRVYIDITPLHATADHRD